MPDTIGTAPRRPLWCRLLHWFGWIFNSLFGLIALLAAVLVAINWKDEEITPEVQDWLTVPPNPVADAGNAWLAMIAIGVEKQPGTTIGRQIVKHLAEVPYQPDMAYLSQFGPAWQFSGIDTGLCDIRQNGPDLLPRILHRQAELQKLASQQKAALARYYAAIALPDFHEETLPNAKRFLPYTPAAKAACLARMDLALRLQAADATAEAIFVQHMRYWLNALRKSSQLFSAMMANAQIQSDLALLQGLLKKKSKGAKRVLNGLRPDLQDLSTLDTTTLRQPLLAGELRFMRDMPPQSGENRLPSLDPRELGLFYKPQASLNFQQFLMTHPEEVKARCDWRSWHYAYNPAGKILVCIAVPHYPQYFDRIRMTQGEAAKLLVTAP